MLSALKLPGVRWIVAAFGLEYLLEMGSAVALMVLVYDATDSPAAAAAMLVVKQVVPGIAVGLVGGRLEGRDPRRALQLGYLVRAVVFGALAVTGYGPALFPLALAAGLSGGVARTATRTLMANSSSGAVFRAATALSNVAFGAVALLGPALGAALAVGDPQLALVVWSGAALVLALLMSLMPAMAVLDDESAEAPIRSTGLRVGWLLVLGGFITAAFAVDSPALLAFSKTLGGGVGGYGAILACWGLGMVGGSLVYARLMHRSLPRVFAGGLVLAATACLGLGLSPTLLIACVFACAGGAGNGIFWVALQTTVLESAPAGRVSEAAGRLEAIASVTPAFGIVAGGVLASVTAPKYTLILPAILVLAAVAAWVTVERDVVVGRRRARETAVTVKALA